MHRIYFIVYLLAYWASGASAQFDLKSTKIEPSDDYNNELKLQTAINTELTQYRAKLNQDIVGYANYNNVNVSSFHLGPSTLGSSDFNENQLTQPTATAKGTSNGRNAETLQNDKYNPNTADMYSSLGQRLKAVERNNCHKLASNAAEKFSSRHAKPHKQNAKQPSTSRGKAGQEAGIFLGTNLFGPHSRFCFSKKDLALMTMRQHFEDLIPKNFAAELLSNQHACALMRYFFKINQVILYVSDCELQDMLKLCFYDSLGAYLHYYLLPAAKASFYAGELPLCTMQTIMKLYEDCLIALNTNGNDWKSSDVFELTAAPSREIKPLAFELCKGRSHVGSCAVLDFRIVEKDALERQLFVALPSLEPADHMGLLTNIRLPFKNRRIYDLSSTKSMYILLKFYRTLTYCHRFHDLPQDAYDQKLQQWIVQYVQPHLNDDKLYPGLAGVLRICETLKSRNAKNRNQGADFGLFSKSQLANSYAESRKPSRSIKFFEAWSKDKVKRRTKHEEQTADAEPQQKRQKGQPTEFEDRTELLPYIGIFLGLLFVMLFFIICCGVCRNRQLNRKPTQQESSSDQEVQPADCRQETGAPADNACCAGLCRSRRKARRRLNNNQKVAKDVEPRHAGPILQNLQSTLPTRVLQFQAQDSDTKPKERPSKVEDLALTSTSSLRFQPARKFFPISRILKSRANPRTSTTCHKMPTKLITINEKQPQSQSHASKEKALPTEVCQKYGGRRESLRKKSATGHSKNIGTKHSHPHATPSASNYYYFSSETEKHSSGQNLQENSNTGSSWKTSFTSS